MMSRHLIVSNNSFLLREDKEHLKRIREARKAVGYGESFRVSDK